MTYAEAQPLAYSLASKLRARMKNQPGTQTPDASTSHPLTFRAIRLSERMAEMIRRGNGEGRIDWNTMPDSSQTYEEELEHIAAACAAEGIE